MGRLVLLSDGLNTTVGLQLIKKQICEEKLKGKKIALFYEPYYSVEYSLVHACQELGFDRKHIFIPMDANFGKRICKANYLYVTEGNTFEILKILKEKGYVKPMKKAMDQGATYIGASAGAIIAGKDILLAEDFDRNEVGLKENEMEALGLFEGTILPHCTKKELTNYMKTKDREVLSRYSKIYQVANGRIKVLDGIFGKSFIGRN